MKISITNQKCLIWTLLTTLIILSAVNIAWALPVNERTQQVQDAIVAAVSGIDSADDVTDAHLAAITTLNLQYKEISTLKSGDFSELSSLTTLYLDNNRLTSLPVDVFSGLSSLKYLYLNNNQLNNLPATLFSSLSSIEEINLHSNRLTRLPDNLFTGLTSLRQLVLHKNLLKSLDADTFSGLSSLEYLYLHNNQLTSLPANLFSKLTLLKHLLLHNNQLTHLSLGMFRGLSTPKFLWLQGNVVNPLPLNVSVVKVGENQFKVIVPAGAPFDMNIPLTVTNGSITSGASGVTIATGAVESIPFTVAHTPDTTSAVSVDIGTLPSPPAFHFGYVLVNYTNTAPVFTEGSSATRSVAENAETGTNIGAAVVATDADDDPLTYTLSGTDAASFAIDNTTGQLKTEAALDFETENAYTVTVTVSDGYGGSDSITITINVTDIDETSPNRAPIFVEGTSTTRAIAENTAADTNIGIAITATDADNDTLTYTLSGNPDAASFAIESTTGQLKTSASLDYETKNTYKVAVTVSDGALTDIINVTINIRDANDAPVFTAGSTATRTIAENTTSDVNIGAAITATDADGDRLTYTLGGTDAASFVIDNTNGQLKTSASLNFETENAYTVIVTASDGSLTDTITVTINVTDVDENLADPAPPNRTPIFVEGDSTTRAVAQDTEQGINIGTPVLATDADDDTLIYTLGGTDAAIFDIDSTTGQLKTKVRLDVETKPFYTVTVTASDGSLTDIITVTINLSSIDENNPPVFTEGESTTRVIAENTAAGTNIGAPITATDADDDTLTYTLSGTDAASFAIENTTGQLKTKASLDYETESSYSVTMTVSDSDLTDVINVNINIRNANDAPIFTEGDSTTRAIAENTAAGANIGTSVVATDADSDTLNYTLSGTDAAAFAIENTTGQLKTKALLDYETESSYSVTMTVSDGDLTDVINVNINIRDVNDAPVFIEGESAIRAIAENTAAGTNIGAPITATDDDDDTLIYELLGTDVASFSIDSTNGQLKTKKNLDYETKDTYSVTILVTDRKLTDTIHVTINISSVDENNPPVFTEGESTTRAIAENTAADTNIGAAITATDADGDPLTYTLGGTDAAAFAIENTTGQLKTKASLDYETESSYSVTMTVSDSDLTDVINVNINIRNANDAPIFTEGDSTTRAIAENTTAGANIGTSVVATDADSDTLNYTLSGTDAAAFAIENTTGQLKTKALLDYETESSYSVTMTVSDGDLTDVINVNINIRNANDAPIFTEGDSTTRAIAENTAAGANIGTSVVATDADSDTLNYTLSGTDAAAFAIENTTGQLKTKALLDYETESSYSVTMTVSDGDLTDVINVNINIRDVNDAPVFIEGESATRAIAENTAAGTNIGAPITATDDDDDMLIYELLGTDVSSFTINSTNGQLKTKKNLDYETKDTYSVTILVTDRKLTDTIRVTINVTDVNENRAPEFTEGDSATRAIAENTAAGTNIGTAITATDADGDPLTYTLGGTDAAAFAIENTTGQLKTKALLDYETESSYSVTMTVSDSDLTDVINVNINIRNANDAPIFTEGDSTTRAIAENTAAGANIGTSVVATDADSDTLNYTLSGTDAAAFAIENTTGQLKTKALLDYETESSYSVTMTVSDGDLTDVINVNINIRDVNDAPVFIEGESTTRAIAENTAAGTNIGAPITATDDDNDTLIYEILGTDVASFSIDSTNGQLKTKKNLDYETKDTYSVTILVTDRKLTDTIRVTINVTDVNENRAPEFTEGDSATRAIAENTAAGTNIGTAITATDADNDTLTYTLGGTNAAAFAIDSETGQLKTKASLDYETKKTYTVTVTVSDSSLTDIITVTINVRDVDENRAPEFTEGDNTTRSVAENTAADTNIGTAISATDADNDTLTYTLSGTDAASFTIVGTSGQLKTSAALDFETKKTYTVTVTVSDGSLTDIITVTINVTDVDENVAPVFTDGDRTTREVAENTASGVNIGNPVSATDANSGDTLTYSLGGTEAASFSIVSTSGQLKTKAALDYETKDSYEVTITVSDGNGGSDEISVTINVTNANDAPVFRDENTPEGFHIITSLKSVAENTPAGQDFGTPISATDADGDNLTYSLGGTLTAPGSDTLIRNFGDDYQAFDIDSATGQLKTKDALDYETKSFYTVVVSVSDGKGGTASVYVEIRVTDVDENRAPVFTEGDTATRSVAENTAADENIGTAITATDADNDTLTYTLSGTDAASFTIVGTSGQLKTSAALDFETKKSYTVTVTVSDSSLTDIITVTINVTDVTENRAPEFTEGDSATRSVAENTAADTNIGTAITATDADDDTLIYGIGGTDAAAFSINTTTGQLKTSAALDFETDSSYSVTVFVSDSNGGSDSITVSITVTDVDESTPVTTFTSVCDRTPQVRDAIVAAAGVNDCSEVTEAHLAAITILDLDNYYATTSDKKITSLKSGDFDGLTSLRSLYLIGNRLTTLPEDIFDELKSLNYLSLGNNQFTTLPEDVFNGLSSLTNLGIGANKIISLPEDVFDGLSSLDFLQVHFNQLSSLPEDVFDGLSSLKSLWLHDNQLSSLPEDVFDGLSSFSILYLHNNQLTSLPEDVFDGLSSFSTLYLGNNQLTSLPEDVFDGLSSLSTLYLYNNQLTSLPEDVFDGLSSLSNLSLGGIQLTNLPNDVFDGLSSLTDINLSFNQLVSLPEDVFDGLSSLTEIVLWNNNLTSLPSDVFDGLSSLTEINLLDNNLTSLPLDVFDGLTALRLLNLSGNAVNPLPLTVSLKKVSDGQFKAVAPTGAPFDIVVPLTVANGSISGSATSITISTGKVESGILTVTRTAGTTAAVTVDIGTLPELPSGHRGYVLTKPTTGLPLEVIPAVNGAPQSTEDTTPIETALLANYPNPSNPETWIPYQLAKPADVSLTIYNVRGVVVRKLALGHQQAGIYHSRKRAAHWDGKNEFGESVASGVYFYVFKAGEYTAMRKMLIRK